MKCSNSFWFLYWVSDVAAQVFSCSHCLQRSGVNRKEIQVCPSTPQGSPAQPPVGQNTQSDISFENIQCLPQCLTFPSSMTRIRSVFITVLMRWAMVSTVQSWKDSLMVLWISVSVSASIDAVASSKRIICCLTADLWITGDNLRRITKQWNVKKKKMCQKLSTGNSWQRQRWQVGLY